MLTTNLLTSQQAHAEHVRRILTHIQNQQPTPYAHSLWELTTNPTTFSGRADLQAAFAACLLFSCNDSPFLREAIAALEHPTTEQLTTLVSEHILHAQHLVHTLSDEEDALLTQIELAHQLYALRAALLTDQELLTTLQAFACQDYQQARQEVIACLVHPTPAIRGQALQTLILGWELDGHFEDAFRFLHDPDPTCREQGIRCLALTSTNVNDPRVLKTYAAIVANQDELPHLRLQAYKELLLAFDLTLPISQQEEDTVLLNTPSFDLLPWIDWSLVTFFSEQRPTYAITLTFQEPSRWIDQQGRIFEVVDELLASPLLLLAHRIAHARFPLYTLTLTLSNTEVPPSRKEPRDGGTA